jgi:hypothetical protein
MNHLVLLALYLQIDVIAENIVHQDYILFFLCKHCMHDYILILSSSKNNVHSIDVGTASFISTNAEESCYDQGNN